MRGSMTENATVVGKEKEIAQSVLLNNKTTESEKSALNTLFAQRDSLEFVEFIDGLRENFRTGTSVILQGGVGIGKTSIAIEIGKYEKRNIYVFHFARHSATDSVITYIDNNGVMRNAINEDFKKAFTDAKGIVIIDEIDKADPQMLNIMLSVLYERTFEGIVLAKSTAIIATCNQQYDRNSITLGQAGITRVCYVDMDSLLKDMDTNNIYYKYWMRYVAHERNIDSRIVSFLSLEKNASYLYKTTEDVMQFSVPRTWELLSNNIDWLLRIKNNIVKQMFADGYIGADAATHFIEFVELYLDMPDAEKLLDNYAQCNILTIEKKVIAIDIVASYINKHPQRVYDGVKMIHEQMKSDELMYLFTLQIKDNKEVIREIQKSNNMKLLKTILQLKSLSNDE